MLDEEVIISMTGYTGELGYEIYISNEKVKDLWSMILKDERVKPAGLGARDTLRLEMGYPLYGQDINTDINPLEAGLGRFIDMKKEFIGREGLIEAEAEGIKKHFLCFASDSRRSPRHGHRIMVDGRNAGEVTSGSYGPSIERGIGMGYTDTLVGPGSAIVITDGKIDISAKTVSRPFYKDGTAKKA